MVMILNYRIILPQTVNCTLFHEILRKKSLIEITIKHELNP